MMRLRHHPRPAGFTLLELLIVVATIALLIAILLPALDAARAGAKRVQCQANLKRIGEAWEMYLQEWKEYFPKGVNQNWLYGGKQGASSFFGIDGANPEGRPRGTNPYLGLPLITFDGADIFRCPGDDGDGVVPTTYYDEFGNSYVANPYYVGQDRINYPPFDPCASALVEINNRLPKARRSLMNNLGKLVLAGDSGWLFEQSPYGAGPPVEWHKASRKHNILFMDGHADFVLVKRAHLVAAEFTIVPYETLLSRFASCQALYPTYVP